MGLCRIKNLLLSFKNDLQGIAAVEFGLIAPVALLIMLGTVELGRAVVMARRFNLVTAVISDLVSREYQMPPLPAAANPSAEMAAIASAALTMWAPYDPTTLKFQVVQVRNASATATKVPPLSNYVDWYYPMFGAPNLTKCAPYAGLPAGMIGTGAANIIVNGWYTYKPLFTSHVPFLTATNWNWTATSSHAPRQYGCSDFNQTNCLPTCEN